MSSDRRPEETCAPHAAAGEPRRWLDDHRNVDKIVYGLYAVCALLLLIDPLVHKHGPFEFEHWWGFYGIYGCVFLVLAAKVLRMIVMRPEDYYDR